MLSFYVMRVSKAQQSACLPAPRSFRDRCARMRPQRPAKLRGSVTTTAVAPAVPAERRLPLQRHAPPETVRDHPPTREDAGAPRSQSRSGRGLPREARFDVRETARRQRGGRGTDGNPGARAAGAPQHAALTRADQLHAARGSRCARTSSASTSTSERDSRNSSSSRRHP